MKGESECESESEEKAWIHIITSYRRSYLCIFVLLLYKKLVVKP